MSNACRGNVPAPSILSVPLAGGNPSISFRAGEFVGLVGPNGVGKSALLRALRGLFDTAGKPAAGPRRAVAYVPQWPGVRWPLSVFQIVAMGRRSFARGLFSRLGEADLAAVESAMARMGLEKLASRPLARLSCGERGRVFIARALASETPVLLADDPTAGLDPAHQIAVMKSFRAVADEGRLAVTALHDLGLAARWCTRLVLLDRQGVAADGSPRDVLKQKNLSDVYGVKAYLGQAAGGPVVELLDTIEQQGVPD